MREKYAILTKLPDCSTSKYSPMPNPRCNGCKIGEVVLFLNGNYWFGTHDFICHCDCVKKENVEFISKEEGEKRYMAQKL